jgi:hypothetical protein
VPRGLGVDDAPTEMGAGTGACVCCTSKVLAIGADAGDPTATRESFGRDDAPGGAYGAAVPLDAAELMARSWCRLVTAEMATPPRRTMKARVAAPRTRTRIERGVWSRESMRIRNCGVSDRRSASR